MHVLTLVANSTLLNYIRRKYRTVLRAGIIGMVLSKQRAYNNQQFNVMAKTYGAKGGGVGVGGLCLEWKVRLSFPKFIFYRIHETLL